MNSFQNVLFRCWDLYHRKFENGVKKDGGFEGCHSGGLWSLLQEILDPLTMSQYLDLNPTSERSPDSKVCLVFTDQLRHKQAAFSHNSLYFAEQLTNKQTWCVNVTGEEHFVPVSICFSVVVRCPMMESFVCIAINFQVMKIWPPVRYKTSETEHHLHAT